MPPNPNQTSAASRILKIGFASFLLPLAGIILLFIIGLISSISYFFGGPSQNLYPILSGLMFICFLAGVKAFWYVFPASIILAVVARFAGPTLYFEKITLKMVANVFSPRSLFSLKGGIGRKHFWVVIGCSGIATLLAPMSQSSMGAQITFCVTVTMMTIAAIKRCKDIGWSSTWIAAGTLPIWWGLAMLFCVLLSSVQGAIGVILDVYNIVLFWVKFFPWYHSFIVFGTVGALLLMIGGKPSGSGRSQPSTNTRNMPQKQNQTSAATIIFQTGVVSFMLPFAALILLSLIDLISSNPPFSYGRGKEISNVVSLLEHNVRFILAYGLGLFFPASLLLAACAHLAFPELPFHKLSFKTVVNLFNPFNLFSLKGRLGSAQFWGVIGSFGIAYLLLSLLRGSTGQSTISFLIAFAITLTIMLIALIKRCKEMGWNRSQIVVGIIPFWWFPLIVSYYLWNLSRLS